MTWIVNIQSKESKMIWVQVISNYYVGFLKQWSTIMYEEILENNAVKNNRKKGDNLNGKGLDAKAALRHKNYKTINTHDWCHKYWVPVCGRDNNAFWHLLKHNKAWQSIV